jgi:hypothetical protein
VALKEENITLRSELEGMQKRLESTERVLRLRQEQDQQLRENIEVARREVITHLDRTSRVWGEPLLSRNMSRGRRTSSLC